MTRKGFVDFLSRADFKTLFNEMGWDHPVARDEIRLTLDGREWSIREVAHKCGFHAYVCDTPEMPENVARRKLDIQLRKYGNDYLIVFVQPGEPFRHQWMVPVKTVEKREIVTVEYEKEDQTAFLFEKLQTISFGLTEAVSIVDVTARIHGAFTVNAAKITKAFYATFQKHHKAFAEKFIEGIPATSETDRQWYASVMLNRLMFCYFIQKKGFLNFDSHYLQTKLRETRERQGRDKFYGSFYRKFLAVLFRDGLNAPRHDAAFEAAFGRIPYLNGGLFEDHEIEKTYPELDIKDRAFEDLFAFFDEWRWHLDTRMTASGRDINPDVLGYIFEQYINDRAKMGAYYTKEDITEYIAKNCILPFLFDAVSRTDSSRHFKPGGFVWRLMKGSGDAFIYPAVKKGVDLPLPPEIECGVAVETKPGDQPLRERRAAWNTPADARHALPTEIWRETVARRQRCAELRRKIAAGEIASINDLVTCNLDIRAFAEAVLEQTDDHLLVRHFYDALRAVTVLDPTCGSGAFLFAALNVLEPLYETCIKRMQEFHDGNRHLFKGELAEIANKYRSNIQHYIYKSIILRNLYGVDIMHEATEIAKLRLFLKMVAVVDVDKRAENLGLDPLPDIDFNIRCGNTLVGFANKDHIFKSFSGDLFGVQEFEQKIDDELEKVSVADRRFKDIQLNERENALSIKTAKDELSKRLQALNDILNKTLYGTANPRKYETWLAKTQPFNWIAEFHQIIHERQGFDVIIGNPPYVELRGVHYDLSAYKTQECGNLYAPVIERALFITRIQSRTGMIIQNSAFCTPRMLAFKDLFVASSKTAWISTFDDRPGKLFDLEHIRVAICLNEIGKPQSLHTSNYVKFAAEYREHVFETLLYGKNESERKKILAKRNTFFDVSILFKLKTNQPLVMSQSKNGQHKVYYHNAPQYFIRAMATTPYFWNEIDGEKSSVQVKIMPFDSDTDAALAGAALNSSLFYWWFILFSDCRHLTNREIDNFPLTLADIKGDDLQRLFKKLCSDYERHKFRKECQYKATGKVIYDEYYPKHSKPIIDEIDTVLAEHYGFTEEELDFIINYDIKYRMGGELGKE